MPGDERPHASGEVVPGLDEAIPLLTGGTIRILGLLPRSSNYTFLARVSEGGREALAVYKPRAGEAPLWDFPEGTLCHREVAAYRVSQALGWPRVPPTVLREGPEGPGSLQLFLEFDPEEHYFTLAERMPDAFRRVALFDVVVNNADRKGGHCLLASDGELFVVDHGVCFHQHIKLRTVIWEFAGDPIDDELGRDLERLRMDLGDDLRTQLDPLLSARELEAMRERLDALLRSGTFPRPGPGRPYPWPPV
ncbi:MAG TPA: SCO1664 family protein [Actinomycetota bacterium]|nr:SCO1664 family protein [Actinomycetota bacterium]